MHIGFGQNTVSSLYGHQKGDHMKTIGFSHKKHKANESQEKMTVTSGKDVCRKIGHSDEVDGTYNQENLPSTDYWFTVDYLENGAKKQFKAHFSLKR
jgi:gliding motility-associated-like protein